VTETLSDFNLGWIVGILEGEGTFDLSNKKYPRVRIEMTDKDSVYRFYAVLGVSRTPRHTVRQDKKDSWVGSIHGPQAKLLMVDVFPHMSERRQQKIQEILLDNG